MAIIRFEAWTRPETGTFERKFPIRGVTDHKIGMGIFGQGSITIPRDHPRLDDILYVDPTDHSNDSASMIRAFIGDTHLYDFYASRMKTVFGDTGSRESIITGGGPGAALDKTKVRQYDYPATPSVEPDWRYGFGPELVKNGDFETDSEGMQNPDAEDGNILGWYTTGNIVSGVGVPNSFEAIKDGPNAHGGSWFFRIEADPYEGVINTFRTYEDEDYSVSAWIKAAVGVDYRMSVDGAKAAVVGTSFSNSVYVDGTGTGAYQNVVLTLTADSGGEGRLHVTSMDTAATVDFDDITVSGFGIGVEPWESRGLFTSFESSTTFAHGGTYSLKWRPSSGIAGNDTIYQPIQVVENANLSASMWVYHTEGSNKLFRLVIRQPGVDPNVSNIASVQKSIPTATWTEIVATGESPMPTVEIEMRWDETGAPTNDLYTDDVTVHQGRAAATVGFILGELLDDAGINHTNRTALVHLVPTFTDTLDSNSVAWDKDIEIVVKRGQSYRRFIEVLAGQFGYEFRIRVNPADDTILWFDAYNLEGMGTDYSLTDGTAVLGAGVVSLGPLLRREPQATYAMIEGEDQWYGEALNLTTQAVWGDIELYEGLDELIVGMLIDSAGLLVTSAESETVVVSFQGSPLTPGTSYLIGDIVRMTLGESAIPSGVYRVYDITAKSGDTEAIFQVQFVSEGT